jgi:hypothetical protein
MFGEEFVDNSKIYETYCFYIKSRLYQVKYFHILENTEWDHEKQIFELDKIVR